MTSRILAALCLIALAGCEGEPGADGVDGTNGANGADGVDGMNGADGADGTNGDNGADGADGIDGQDGANGSDGAGIGIIRASFSGLTDLGPDFAYEGWIIVDGAPVSTGVFHVDADGYQTQSSFLALDSDVAEATRFVLTIEPVPDPDPAPSATHILGGDFVGDAADVTVGHESAIGDDFSAAEGSFILATPSTAADATDDSNGIWWLDPTGSPDPGFTGLPDLTDSGWRYEGWVVGPDGPISTGVFASATEEDSDGAGPTAGPDGTPPFPGQDFISPAIDLTTGYAAVLTIEPYPDNDPAPFGALKPLVDHDITPVAPPMSQAMDNESASFPTGSITR